MRKTGTSTTNYDDMTYVMFVNVIDMLNMRGYNIGHLSWVLEMVYGTSAPFVPQVPVKVDKRQLITDFGRQMAVFLDRISRENPGKTVRQAMSQKFTPRPGVTDRPVMWVVFVEPFDDKGQINSARVREYLNQYTEEHNKASMSIGEVAPRYMFVTKAKLSTTFADVVTPMSNTEFWREEQLLINPYRHILHPQVRPATDAEILRLKIDPAVNPYAQVKGGKTKLWFLNDIAVSWMNYPLGGVYYVQYYLPITGTLVPVSDEYRLIVPATGKETTTEKTKKVEKSEDEL